MHTLFVDEFVARTYPGHEAEMMHKLAASRPIGRMGTPEEIALLALYLCSPASSFVTGVDYPIDGGFINLRWNEGVISRQSIGLLSNGIYCPSK